MLTLASDTVNPLPWHTAPPLPAFTKGFGIMLNTISSLTLPHGEFPSTVIVSVILPVSPLPGVYVGVKVVAPVIFPVAPEFAVHSIDV